MPETTPLQPKPLLAKAASSPHPVVVKPQVEKESVKTTLSTSKVWVLPPRPKPGRKPSSDTPPSKRKAQNRAAQRAFRERRAALVNELEEKLSDIDKERANKEAKMQSTIRALMKENESLKVTVNSLQHGMRKNGKSNKSDGELTMEDLDRALEQKLPVPVAKLSANCGICVKDDCLCEQVGLKDASLKEEPQEIDFTDVFSRPKKRSKQGLESPKTSSTSSSPFGVQLSSAGGDGCGFCSEGTPCVCREAAAAEAAREASSTTLPPISELSLPTISNDRKRQFSYRSSVETSYVSPPPSSRTSRKSSCTGNPGTCYQCQSDPMSTLFCTTLASRGRTTDMNGKRQVRQQAPLNPAEPGTFIPCAAAYQTLARHKDFRSADFGNMVSKLQTRGMEVEVNSVAKVLRELDRRLYD